MQLPGNRKVRIKMKAHFIFVVSLVVLTVCFQLPDFANMPENSNKRKTLFFAGLFINSIIYVFLSTKVFSVFTGIITCGLFQDLSLHSNVSVNYSTASHLRSTTQTFLVKSKEKSMQQESGLGHICVSVHSKPVDINSDAMIVELPHSKYHH